MIKQTNKWENEYFFSKMLFAEDFFTVMLKLF